MKLYLLTQDKYVAPSEQNDYIDNVLLEDRLLSDALKDKGFEVERVDWSDPTVDWQSGDAAIFRATWDYFDRYDEFKTWLRETAKKIRFINPVETIQWNMDKRYLADLKKKGVAIVPTEFIQPGDSRSLQTITYTLDWKEMILKPAIGGGGRHTYRMKAGNVSRLEAIHAELIANEAMLIQPFIENVIDAGEVSYMCFGGKYSHAILKRAKPGDFRVQDDFGGTVHGYTASQEEIDYAESVCKACEPVPVYGRVDVMVDGDGRMLLSELELIEPELWFREDPEAAGRMAEVVSDLLNG